MIKKHYYSWQDVEKMCVSIVNQMYKDNWRPDYIVGITRGGNVPATIISNITGIRCEALKISLRDDRDNMGPESNCWMAEDAFGYPNSDTNNNKKNILIVDDINDTGATFKYIEEKFGRPERLKFAALVDNTPSGIRVDFKGYTIDKSKDPAWIVFPWEDWEK